jgi:cytidyltransferase-like protein
MEPKVWNKLIAAIHESGMHTVIAITGGGSGAIGRLLGVPGGSRTLLEAVVPYASSALVEFLGGVPDQFCSERTARSMAMAAWVRARRLAGDVDPHSLFGVGVTASLVSDQPKKGDHRIHVGVQTARATKTLSLVLTKGARTRKQEEALATKLVILALAEACGVETAETYEHIGDKVDDQETLVHHVQLAEPAWERLLWGETKCVGCDVAPKVVFPGAFNPLHRGHRKMAQFAAEKCGSMVAYELSITNVDKPPLDFVEIADRLQAIHEEDPTREVILTAAPTFVEKAALMPGTTFIVGADTVVRIAQAKYYGNDERRRDAALAEIAQAGCRFLVFGRQVGERFCCLGDVELPAGLRALCDEVGEGEFHEDVSSTEMRREG